MKKASADSVALRSSQYVYFDAWAHPGGPQEDTVEMVWADLDVGDQPIEEGHRSSRIEGIS